MLGLFNDTNNSQKNINDSLLAIWGVNCYKVIVTDLIAQNFPFGTIGVYLLTDSNFAQLDALNNDFTGNLAGLDLPAGLFLPLNTDRLQLASGSILVLTKEER